MSHAHADRGLVDPFVETILDLGCGIDESEIFYSSGPGMGVSVGADLTSTIRSRVADASLVVSIITPAFTRSAFCVAELGAAWAMTDALFPLLVPRLAHDDLDGVLSTQLIKYVNDGSALDQLHYRLAKAFRRPLNTERWIKYRSQWLANVDSFIATVVLDQDGLRDEAPAGLTAAGYASVGVERTDDRSHTEMWRVMPDGSIEHCWLPRDEENRSDWSWGEWQHFPCPIDAVDIAAVNGWPQDHAEVFVLARDGRVVHRWWRLQADPQWSEWLPLPAPATEPRPAISIAAASKRPGRMDVYVQHADRSVRTYEFHHGDHDWRPGKLLPAAPHSKP